MGAHAVDDPDVCTELRISPLSTSETMRLIATRAREERALPLLVPLSNQPETSPVTVKSVTTPRMR